MENIMLDMIFFIQNDVATGLKISFEDLGKNGLAAVAGENVEVVLHWVLEVNLRLKKVRQILTKISIHFFEDLIFCSVSKFKELFSLLLDQERVTQLNIAVGIYDTSTAALVCVRYILQQEFISYHSLCISNYWFIQGHINSCWNCGGDHGLRDFQNQNNQNMVQANKRRW